MSDQPVGGSPAVRVADELGDCRQRGLADLDLRTHNQVPVAAPEIERLAREYCAARGLTLHGRPAQIRQLLQDSLSAYASQGNADDAHLISRLFFDPAIANPKLGPGHVLSEAQEDSGLNEEKFRRERRRIFIRFAGFLIAFVADAEREATKLPTPVGEAGAPTLYTATARRRSPPVWVGAVVAGLVLIAGTVIAIVVREQQISGAPPGTQTLPTPAHIGIPGGNNTYIEQGDNKKGSVTYTDPYHPTVTGVTIQYLQQVQVSCKVYSVPADVTSVYPDGYWYRIASSPWNNKYYAIANTFLNGDSLNGPTMNNTDFKVPNCPG